MFIAVLCVVQAAAYEDKARRLEIDLETAQKENQVINQQVRNTSLMSAQRMDEDYLRDLSEIQGVQHMIFMKKIYDFQNQGVRLHRALLEHIFV